MYKQYVADYIGAKKICDIKYSDVVSFYKKLAYEYNISWGTITNVHFLLKPVFAVAVRNGYIRNNPTGGALANAKKEAHGFNLKGMHWLFLNKMHLSIL